MKDEIRIPRKFADAALRLAREIKRLGIEQAEGTDDLRQARRKAALIVEYLSPYIESGEEK